MKKISYILILALLVFPIASEGRRSSSDLEEKIDDLSSKEILTVYMPVLFGVRVTDISPNFGDPRSGGRTHEGEDIMALKGTPIVTPTQAVVLRTGVGETEGNYVYTANPGGETYVYMHLDEIADGLKSGQELAPGALLGFVGNTGNASGGAAHLHFEIHDDSGEPIDPFPRLTLDIPLKDKITYLDEILDDSDDPEELAEFLVSNFSNDFVLAQSLGITLPGDIVDALGTIKPAIQTVVTTSVIIPTQSTVELQNYLINQKKGPAAIALASVSATGYFGSLTTAALAEFQSSVGITPAVGNYGPITKAYIAAHPVVPNTTVTDPPVTPVRTEPIQGTTSVIRDLKQGMTGEDVRALQVLLNNNGYVVSTTGPGSPGLETTYFGSATQAAVIKFQQAKNISPAAGYVGSLTRTALANL